jgi:hypothetical protein
MDRFEGDYGFHFDDHYPLYDEVEAIGLGELPPAVSKRQDHLSLDVQSRNTQLVCEALSIGRLEQSRPDLPMDLDASPNHLLRNLIELVASQDPHPLPVGPHPAQLRENASLDNNAPKNLRETSVSPCPPSCRVRRQPLEAARSGW